MNILVIGNGFDLAHGLPTKYTDFLDWTKKMEDEYCKNPPSKDDISNIFDFIIGNSWIEYFYQCDMHGSENWIDFECEIGNVIMSLDMDMGNEGIYSKVYELTNDFLAEKYLVDEGEMYSFKDIRDVLIADLNELIRGFEIYLYDYIRKVEIKKISPDIKSLDIDHILSFNYTDTYERVYGKENIIEYDYIHGKADSNNTIESNNMVLGIDEYLPDDRKDKDVEFIAFKKFYQRIHKQTGCKYKEWVDEIKKEYMEYLKNEERVRAAQDVSENFPFQKRISLLSQKEECPRHNLYIFGHSLDVTDKDILRDLILNDNVYTTIYYFSKDDLGTKIANLVKVIGQDELIKRTGGSTKTIEFKLQQDMVER